MSKGLIAEKARDFLFHVKREAIDLPDYEVVEASEPRLYKELFPWSAPPKMTLDGVVLHPEPAENIWITDTTFRDGQQAREPYTAEQMVKLYDSLHRLGGPSGRILNTEFFLYTKRDREAIECCRRLNYTYPAVTGWVRASKQDLKMVKDMSLEETGILASVSDYHIFYKFPGLGRVKVIEGYLDVVEEALKYGITVRVHLEDCTRADVFSVIVPFVKRLMKLSREYGLPVKIRCPDTLGVGLPWPEASLPRGVPKLMWILGHVADVPSEWLEFHGHNDFHLGVANAMAAWMYGASLNNCTLLGIGERAGNVPLEALVMAYAGLKGSFDGMDTRVIKEIAELYRKELGYTIPSYYPLVGENFTITKSGVHADGFLKHPDVYLPFDTGLLLDTLPGASVSQYSGLAGIAFWINHHFQLTGDDQIQKTLPQIKLIHDEVAIKYENGRVTDISSMEMCELVKKYLPDVWAKFNAESAVDTASKRL